MDLFLAVAALFGAGIALSSHSQSSNGELTTLDVATVLGQGSVVAGKTGAFNRLAPYLPPVRVFEQDRFGLEVQNHTNDTWSRHLGIRSDADNFHSPQLVVEEEPQVINRSELTTPAALNGDYAGPDPNHYFTTRARTEAEVQAGFAPTVRILSAALNVVEWGAMPLFGSCFGVFSGDLGNMAGPDHGEQIRASKVQFASGLGELAYAYPNSPEWDSDSAVEYAVLDSLMYSLAAQAGVDGMISIYGIDTNTSLDTLAHTLIDRQATQVELMMGCLAAIGIGLMLCIMAALAMGGFSWQFQLAMASIGVGAAGAVVGVMANSWASQNEADVNQIADAFNALAASVPAEPPPGPPSAGLLAAGSGSGMFTELNISTKPDSAHPTSTSRAVHQTPEAPIGPLAPGGSLSGVPVAAQSAGGLSRQTASLQPSDSSTRSVKPAPNTAAEPTADPHDTADAAAATNPEHTAHAAVAARGADQLAAAAPGKPRRALSPMPPIPHRKA
ncbi:MAG: hypothetical protein K2Q25_03900 [Mycobacteriaceae bacterium]|nr:hypothetical protein [Mycobacteriaceae bacterium]